jgi:HSP20 family protein
MLPFCNDNSKEVIEMLAKHGHFENALLGDFSRMQRELEDLFGYGAWSPDPRSTLMGSYPPINMGSTTDRVDLNLFVSGIDTNDLDLSIQQNQLVISGERRLIEEEGADYYRKERFEGKFRRVITLPDDVDPEHVEATYRDGVLHISVARRESAKPRVIEVKT